MSSSTTQIKKSKTSAAQNGEAKKEVVVEDGQTDAFHRELTKKIRNKVKKLDKIADVEKRVKAKEIVPNDEQRTMIAGKPAVEAEIADLKGYLDLYASSKKEGETKERDIQKSHKKELTQAKKAVVTTIANMITMHSMIECGQTVPEEIEEGVKHFSESLKKILVDGKDPSHWRQERDAFISSFTKLVNGSQESVPHCDVSYEEVSTGVAECISSGGYPEVIKRPFKQREPRKKSAKPKDKEPEEQQEAVVEAVQDATEEKVEETQEAI